MQSSGPHSSTYLTIKYFCPILNQSITLSPQVIICCTDFTSFVNQLINIVCKLFIETIYSGITVNNAILSNVAILKILLDHPNLYKEK